MPRPTPLYPFDPAVIHASGAGSRDAGLTPSGARAPEAPPLVFGGILRGDSPFLDFAPPGRQDDEDADDAEADDGPSDDHSDDAALDGMMYMPLIAVAPEPPEPEPAGPATPFDREAVERARARAARPRARVEATVWSDDGNAEHVCDVSAWLAAATRGEVEALAAAGWAGDEAQEVAAALADDDPEVAEVLRHARRSDAGVVVEIDGPAAIAWLAHHRPAVAAALDDDAGDEE